MTDQILVVDDDRISRLVLRHMLTQLGFDSVEAWDVESARLTLAEFEPWRVICDLLLPDGTGLDIMDALRERYPQTPFVLLSGVTERDQADDPRIEQVQVYLTKPVSTSELASALDSA